MPPQWKWPSGDEIVFWIDSLEIALLFRGRRVDTDKLEMSTQ